MAIQFRPAPPGFDRTLIEICDQSFGVTGIGRHRQCLQQAPKPLLALTRRGFGSLVLGDVPALHEQVFDLPGLAPDGLQREINRDGDEPGLLAVDVYLVSDELSGGGALDGAFEIFPNLFRDLPPAGGPEGLPLDLLNPMARALQGGAVYL